MFSQVESLGQCDFVLGNFDAIKPAVGFAFATHLKCTGRNVNQFHGDPVTAGASAVKAAEDKALHAELETREGQMTITMLWGLKKFFDRINIAKLV